MTAYTETVGTDTASVVRVFDDANQLLTSTDTEEGTTSFYYDNNGSLTQILPPGVGGGDWAGALRYGYNQRQLLITGTVYITDTGWANQVQYVYDGEGNRVQQVDYTGPQPVTTTYTNDNSDLSSVIVATDGATTTHNLFGQTLISQDDGAEVRTLLADGLGSARIEMAGGAVEAASTYEPFGKLLARTGETGTVYGYVGEQFDGASDLVYLRARLLQSSAQGIPLPRPVPRHSHRASHTAWLQLLPQQPCQPDRSNWRNANRNCCMSGEPSVCCCWRCDCRRRCCMGHSRSNDAKSATGELARPANRTADLL